MADTDPDKFLADIENFETITWNKINRIVKVISNQLFSDVVKDTPVDSGRAQNNWIFSAGTTPVFKTITSASYDKTGEVASRKIGNGIKRAPTVTSKNIPTGVEYYLTNELPYISMLEYGLYTPKSSKNIAGGYSKKAVGGMVRKNLQKYSKLVVTQVSKFKGRL